MCKAGSSLNMPQEMPSRWLPARLAWTRCTQSRGSCKSWSFWSDSHIQRMTRSDREACQYQDKDDKMPEGRQQQQQNNVTHQQ